jgi:hypothetical protein
MIFIIIEMQDVRAIFRFADKCSLFLRRTLIIPQPLNREAA